MNSIIEIYPLRKYYSSCNQCDSTESNVLKNLLFRVTFLTMYEKIFLLTYE